MKTKAGKKVLLTLVCAALTIALGACSGDKAGKKSSQITIGIPQDVDSLDPHKAVAAGTKEVLFNVFEGLVKPDSEGNLNDAVAESHTISEDGKVYTFTLRDGVKFHDGTTVTAEDVKYSIDRCADTSNGDPLVSAFLAIDSVNIIDEKTVEIVLKEGTTDFLPYLTAAIIPATNEDPESNPIGTGPYKMTEWDEGQAIVLEKNEEYFKGEPNIDEVIFKIVPDDNAKALQMDSGELDLALLTPKDAQGFADKEGYTCYDMKTSDYRGILFNFNNEYWTENKDIIPAVCYGIDREAIIQAILLGQGMPAYGPLQRNIYNNENVEHYDYNPEKAKEILESVGCTMGDDGFYYRNGEKLGFVISVGAGDQVRIDIAQAAAQQLKEIGLDVTVEIPAQVDWGGQMAYLIGWGSPFDADDHTYKVFGTDKGANYSGYSNALVDQYLTEARQSDDPAVRKEAYDKFQEELAKDPAFAFICYVDANYVAKSSVQGIDADTVMGHHGVGIFWNIAEWTMEE